MQIFVRPLVGSTVTLDVSALDTVESLKARIESLAVVDGARFVCCSRWLAPEASLAEAGVVEAATLEVMLEVDGGGKKRKKKVYTKPKKVAHKHKSVKLAVLQYYQVEGNGKVTKKRRECPHADCGAGVFMAEHEDRFYCGKCHMTYMTTDKTA